MGNLSLKSKLFNRVIFTPFQTRYIRFKGPVGTNLYNFIDPSYYFNVVNGDYTIDIFLNGINGTPTTFVSDTVDWYDSSGTTVMNNYVIPLNAIFKLESTNNIMVALDLGGNAENYFQGKTSIKKQNLGNGKFQIQKTYFNTINILDSQGIVVSLKLNGFPTFAQLFGGASFIGLNNGDNVDNKFIFNGDFSNTIEFLDQNYQSIVVYAPYAGSFYDAVAFNEYGDNDLISAGSVNGKTNVIPAYMVLSTNPPTYNNTIVKLFNNNLAKITERV